MAQKGKDENCCEPAGTGTCCCKVEALVSVDDRGQMVLPKELREKANIRAGDKLALINWEKEGQICCLCLIKAEELTDMVKGMLGPMMKGIIAE